METVPGSLLGDRAWTLPASPEQGPRGEGSGWEPSLGGKGQGQHVRGPAARGAGPHPSLLPRWQLLGPMPRPFDLHRIPDPRGRGPSRLPVSWGSGSAPRNISPSAMDRRFSGAWPRHAGHVTAPRWWGWHPAGRGWQWSVT